MIQEFLQQRLNFELKDKTLFEVQQATGIKTTSLSRLARDGKASIKTCEALVSHFGKAVLTNELARLSTVASVNELVKQDTSLDDTQRFMLTELFRHNYVFVSKFIDDGGLKD